MRGRTIGPLLPEPRHGRGVLQGQHREGGEREQGERPDDDRGAAPALGHVEPVGEDEDGDHQHGILEQQLRPQLLAVERELQHHPILDEGDAAGEQADHRQLQRLEPGQRDGPPAPEQGDEAREGQEDHPVASIERRVLHPEDGAPPEGRGGHEQDVDDRQLAQPRPHDVRGLGDRVSPCLRRDRLPRGKTVGAVGRRVPGGGDRPGPLRGDLDAGGPGSSSAPEAGPWAREASGTRPGLPARLGPGSGRPRPAGRRPRRRRRGATPPAQRDRSGPRP